MADLSSVIDTVFWFLGMAVVTTLAVLEFRRRQLRREEYEDSFEPEPEIMAETVIDRRTAPPLSGDPMDWSQTQLEDFDIDRRAFDPAAYLEANPDVSGTGIEPWEHWRSQGRYQGRPLRAG